MGNIVPNDHHSQSDLNNFYVSSPIVLLEMGFGFFFLKNCLNCNLLKKEVIGWMKCLDSGRHWVWVNWLSFLLHFSFTFCDRFSISQLPADLWRLPSLHTIYLDHTPFDYGLRSVHHAQSSTPSRKIFPQSIRPLATVRCPSQPPPSQIHNETRRMLDEFRAAAEA